MNGRSVVIGFVLGVMMARAYTAQIAQFFLQGNSGYVFGSAVQGVQGQLLNASGVIDYVKLTAGTALICGTVIGTSLFWPGIERAAMGIAGLVQRIREISGAYNGEAEWNR